jgi:hypothetical protein
LERAAPLRAALTTLTKKLAATESRAVKTRAPSRKNIKRIRTATIATDKSEPR